MNDSSTASDVSSLRSKRLGGELDEKVHSPKLDDDTTLEGDRTLGSPTEEQEGPEKLTGYPLVMLVAAISLAGFLYALDVNIIVTVSSVHFRLFKPCPCVYMLMLMLTF